MGEASKVMDILENTHWVQFELSNMCNLAWRHHECPMNLEMASPFRFKNPKHLPSKIVYHVLDALPRLGYLGAVYFNHYSEPTIDPRLTEFIRYARERLPGNTIEFTTNGVFLSKQLAIELRDAGLTGLHVTLYGSQEDRSATQKRIEEEIIPVFAPDTTGILQWALDDRLTCEYTRPIQVEGGNCYAPISTIVITRDGDWALCCRDWKRTVTFGNLHEHTFEELLSAEEPWEAYDQLGTGHREIFEVCRRCTSAITPK